MTVTKQRVLALLTGIGLCVLSGMKVTGPPPGMSQARFVLPASVGVIEAILGVTHLFGRAPRVAALGTGILGAGFCLWFLFGEYIVGGPRSCGCAGKFNLGYAGEGVIAAGVLVLGVWCYWWEEGRQPCSSAGVDGLAN